jgi:WD40 repeat protein
MNSPTITVAAATQAGVILGTAAYMSPEQALGEVVDKRADIWSYGVVLFEMLSGRRVFSGKSVSEILGSVLRGEPDWSALPAATPPRIRKLLRRCLDRNCKRRLRDIGEARIVIDGPEEEPKTAPEQRRGPLWLGLAAGFTIAAALATGILFRAPRRTENPVVRTDAELARLQEGVFRLDGQTILAAFRPGTHLAVSPDGTRLVVTMRDTDGMVRLGIRKLDESQFVPLAGTDGPGAPFFSTDGQWIGFFTQGKLKKIPVQGGATVALCDAGNFSAGSWGDDGNIIAALQRTGKLSLIPSSGGAPKPVTELNNGEIGHRWPQVLPGSQAVLFTAISGAGPEDSSIEVFSLKTRERKTVVRGGVIGRYLPSGYLVYVRGNTLFAAPFNLGKLAVTGASQPVLKDVSAISATSPGDFDFSQTGMFVYISGEGEPPRSIFWLDSAGKTRPLHPAPGFYDDLRFSPDGKRLVFAMGDNLAQEDIWVQDLERDTEVRLTSLPGTNNSPLWFPDGKYILFESGLQANSGVYRIRSDGSGEPQRLSEAKAMEHASSLSPDGKRVAIEAGNPFTGMNVWTSLIEGDPEHPRLGKAEPLLRASFFPQPAFSPDGRWVAYSSSETGTDEVYVRPFPGPSGKWKISNGGGMYPNWSHDGRLFFLDLDFRVMSADYTARGDSFAAGKPRAWSEKRVLVSRSGGPYQPFDVTPDGKRLAVSLYLDGTAERKNTIHLTFLLNFFDELRRRVPVGE